MEPEAAARHAINSHLDTVAAVLESQLPSLLAGAGRLTRCLLEEGRLFACGSGAGAANAQYFTARMLDRLERERPGLPVFCLSDGAALLTSIAGNYGMPDVYSRPLRALGQERDVLVTLSAVETSAHLVQAILAAHDRGMDVVALTCNDGGDTTRVLGPSDIEIRVPTGSSARAEEAHLLLLNVLCDITERELFGDIA